MLEISKNPDHTGHTSSLQPQACNDTDHFHYIEDWESLQRRLLCFCKFLLLAYRQDGNDKDHMLDDQAYL